MEESHTGGCGRKEEWQESQDVREEKRADRPEKIDKKREDEMKDCEMEKKHYYGIDWLRAMACIGIVMMHIQANNTYHLTGFIADRMIPSFTDFTFLFMTISAFGMCVGYYEKVKSGKADWVNFYKKRYQKCCEHRSFSYKSH